MVRNGICAQWPLFVVISVIPAAFASVSYANVIWDTSTYHVSDLIETNGYANNGATVYLESNVLLDGELQIHQSSEVTLSDTCRVTDSVYLRDSESFFLLDGGTVRNLILHGGSDAVLESGRIEERLELISGKVHMRGGFYGGDEVDCKLASVLTLEGYAFTVNGYDILPGMQTSFSMNGEYHVTGMLADGNEVDFTVFLSSATLNLSATAVPGSAGMGLALAALGACSRRRRRS